MLRSIALVLGLVTLSIGSEVLYKSNSVTRSSQIISVDEESATSILFTFNSPDVRAQAIVKEGVKYKKVITQGFGFTGEVGAPQLPSRSFKLATSEMSNIRIDTLEIDSVIVKSVLPLPAQEHRFAVIGVKDDYSFIANDSLYRTTPKFPAQIIKISQRGTYKGINIQNIEITPMRVSLSSKEATIYTHLKLRIHFDAPTNLSNLSENALKQVSTIVLNKSLGKLSRAKPVSSVTNRSTDVIIVTNGKYMSAIKKLAKWQRQKGFDVKILKVSPSNDYTKFESKIEALYKSANVKPSYLIIFGNKGDIPGFSISKHGVIFDCDRVFSAIGTKSLNTNYYPDMASGRISVSDETEADIVVNKIINYEKNPPQKKSFYKSALACAYFQDQDEDKMPGYEDRSFVEVIERINNYLRNDHNINSKRIYSAFPQVTPTNWNSTDYSFGKPIPDHLKRPGFQWNGNASDIKQGIENGSFLVYHYDHGSEQGWGNPAFSTGDIEMLENGDKLPVIYSIDCLIGHFSQYTPCFAEQAIRKENGGAIGVVAAAGLSYSGPNDALLQGLIDATWPSDKMIFKSPTYKNPQVTAHDNVYRLGDILDQGLMRMEEMWEDASYYHFEIYHYFGDPTTEMWTKAPSMIESNINNLTISKSSTEVKLSNLNISKGVITLYNKTTDKIIGKNVISGNSVTVAIDNGLTSIGDSVIVTVTSHNHKPLILTTAVDNKTSIVNEITPSTPSLIYHLGKVQITGFSGKTMVKLVDFRGRIVKSVELNIKGDNNSIANFNSGNGISRGVYLISVDNGSRSLRKRVAID